MGWKSYTVTLEAERPSFLPTIVEPDQTAKQVGEHLAWMDPDVAFTEDSLQVRLSMPAASAEGALAHIRGILKSALNSVGHPQVGNWPLVQLSAEASTGTAAVAAPTRGQ